jgi:hypothetical protein
LCSAAAAALRLFWQAEKTTKGYFFFVAATYTFTGEVSARSIV